MRKVGTEKYLEEKKKTNAIYIGVFMLGVLVLGTIGYAFSAYRESTNANNGNQDVNPDGKFGVEFEGQTFYLTNSLEQVKEVPVETTIGLNDYVGKTLYFSVDDQATLYESYQFLSKYSNRLQEACYGSCNKDLPEKNCTENMIIWKESENNKVYQQDKCVFIEGDLRAVDAFLYKIMGLK